MAHRAVDEIWYILAGQGQMWRRQADRQETVSLRPGTCVSIPAGTHFQFRSGVGGPLAAVGVTMPPWPGDYEAHEVPGAWDTASMTEQATEPLARFVSVSLDCPDPAGLADFYLELLGGQVLWRSADSAGIRVPGVVLAMQRVAGYRPPTWPGSSVVHVDLTAGQDVEAAAARAVAAGAVRAEHQPDPRWRVLLDPAGHPFCITTITPPDA